MKDRFAETYRKIISEGYTTKPSAGVESYKELYGKTIVKRTLEFYPGYAEKHGGPIYKREEKLVIKRIVKRSADARYEVSFTYPLGGRFARSFSGEEFGKWINGLSQKPVFNKSGKSTDGKGEWYDSVSVCPVQATFDVENWGYGDDLEHYVFEEYAPDWGEFNGPIKDQVLEMRKKIEDQLAAFDKRYAEILNS